MYYFHRVYFELSHVKVLSSEHESQYRTFIVLDCVEQRGVRYWTLDPSDITGVTRGSRVGEEGEEDLSTLSFEGEEIQPPQTRRETTGDLGRKLCEHFEIAELRIICGSWTVSRGVLLDSRVLVLQ